tara:strand:+ start:221 stop:508 length:288 start_codon:yes stop_codon:yes gene_type:complete
LVIPLAIILSIFLIPFLWTPDLNNFNTIQQQEKSQNKSTYNKQTLILQNSKFQKYMTVGFLIILILITISGIMLYGILKHQREQWQKRFPKDQRK